MGCINSKNRVGPAPQDDNNSQRRGARNRTQAQTTRPPLAPLRTRPAIPEIKDGRKPNVCYEVSVYGKPCKSLILKHPPKKRRTFQPLSHPTLSAETLMERQRLADAKREEALQMKVESALKANRRVENVVRIKVAEREQSAEQIAAQLEAAKKVREARQKEIIEKQRARAERARQVRLKRSEPLNAQRLAAEIPVERKQLGSLKAKENIQKKMELLTQRRKEFVKEKEFDEKLKAQIKEAQQKAARNRELTQDRIVHQQRMRAVRANHVRRRGKELKIPDKQHQIPGVGEYEYIEGPRDDCFDEKDVVEMDNYDASAKKRSPEYDPFFDG